VQALVDVRRHPGSRRHPQFARAALEATLQQAGMRYVWLGETLGGRRSGLAPPERSPNRAWREPAFRAYADHMLSEAFAEGLAVLERVARERPTAILCAELLWWKCHRRLLADRLVAAGWCVVHLRAAGRSEQHALSEWARLEGGVLTYPALL
jgi:uncharacterized protein (DUF488 family)